MKAKFFSGIILVVLLVGLFFRNFKENNNALEISNDVEKILKINNIQNSSIETLSLDKVNLQYDFKTKVTKKEIDEYIQLVVDSYEKIIATKHKKVRKNDVATINYRIVKDGAIEESFFGEQFVVGKYEYNKEIEDSIIGKRRGETYEINDSNQRDCKYYITVKKIEKFKKYTFGKKFVINQLGYHSIKEYKKSIKKILLKQKENEYTEKNKEKLVSKIIKKSKFKIKDEEMVKYSINIVEQYERTAYLYNMSLEQYYEKLLGITKQEFYEKCLSEGEGQIKRYLMIGAVAKRENIVITNDEWESEKIDKEIELQDNNAVIYARYQLLEKKYWTICTIQNNFNSIDEKIQKYA